MDQLVNVAVTYKVQILGIENASTALPHRDLTLIYEWKPQIPPFIQV